MSVGMVDGLFGHGDGSGIRLGTVPGLDAVLTKWPATLGHAVETSYDHFLHEAAEKSAKPLAAVAALVDAEMAASLSPAFLEESYRSVIPSLPMIATVIGAQMVVSRAAIPLLSPKLALVFGALKIRHDWLRTALSEIAVALTVWTAVERLMTELGEILPAASPQLVAFSAFAAAAPWKMMNPFNWAKLLKGFFKAPDYPHAHKVLQQECLEKYLAGSSPLVQGLKRWWAVSAPCRITQIRTVVGAAYAPLALSWYESLEGDRSTWAQAERAAMAIMMGVIMRADKWDGNRARDGKKYLDAVLKGKTPDKTDIAYIATRSLSTHHGANLDANSDKFLMNFIYTMLMGWNAIQGNAVETAMLGSYTDVVKMDATKNDMRAVFNTAGEHPSTHPAAKAKYQSAIPADLSGKAKAFACMTAASTVLGPTTEDAVWYKDPFMIITAAGLFFGRGASRSSIATYQKRARETVESTSFRQNMGDEALAVRLTAQLGGKGSVFERMDQMMKRWGSQ